MGIRGGSVLVPWRPAFWIDAEVVTIYPGPRSQREVREATPVSPRCLRPSTRPASPPPRPSACQEGLLEPARDNRHPPCSLGWLEPACEQRECQLSTEIPWSVDHMEEHPKSRSHVAPCRLEPGLALAVRPNLDAAHRHAALLMAAAWSASRLNHFSASLFFLREHRHIFVLQFHSQGPCHLEERADRQEWKCICCE